MANSQNKDCEAGLTRFNVVSLILQEGKIHVSFYDTVKYIPEDMQEEPILHIRRSLEGSSWINLNKLFRINTVTMVLDWHKPIIQDQHGDDSTALTLAKKKKIDSIGYKTS